MARWSMILSDVVARSDPHVTESTTDECCPPGVLLAHGVMVCADQSVVYPQTHVIRCRMRDSPYKKGHCIVRINGNSSLKQ